jgi:hypothetical protein
MATKTKTPSKAKSSTFEQDKAAALVEHRLWRERGKSRPKGSASTRSNIYVLADPVTRAIRYVGKANDPDKRLASHLRDARTRNRPVCNWIAKLMGQGLQPIMEVLLPDVEDWRAAEVLAIERCRAAGHDLLNLAKGGDDIPCPKAVRDQNAKRLSQYNKTGATKKKVETHEDLIRYTYTSVLGLAIRAGNQKQIVKTQERMRQRAQEQPEHFGDWKDMGLK